MALPNPPAKLADGRVSIGRRPITDAERADLRKRYRRHRRRKLIFGIAIALLPFYCFGVLYWAPLDNPSLALPALFGTIFGVGFLITVANDALQPVPRAALEAATEVERFQNPNGDEVTEVVAGCGAVLTHDGISPTRLVWAPVFTPATPAAATAIGGSGRALSDAELDEIRAIAGATRRQIRKEAPLSLFGLAISPIFLFADANVATFPFLFGLLCLGIGVRGIFAMVGGIRTAKRLEADAQDGQVWDVNRSEVLSHSRLTWTMRGEPASWRSSHMPRK